MVRARERRHRRCIEKALANDPAPRQPGDSLRVRLDVRVASRTGAGNASAPWCAGRCGSRRRVCRRARTQSDLARSRPTCVSLGRRACRRHRLHGHRATRSVGRRQHDRGVRSRRHPREQPWRLTPPAPFLLATSERSVRDALRRVHVTTVGVPLTLSDLASSSSAHGRRWWRRDVQHSSRSASWCSRAFITAYAGRPGPLS